MHNEADVSARLTYSGSFLASSSNLNQAPSYQLFSTQRLHNTLMNNATCNSVYIKTFRVNQTSFAEISNEINKKIANKIRRKFPSFTKIWKVANNWSTHIKYRSFENTVYVKTEIRPFIVTWKKSNEYHIIYLLTYRHHHRPVMKFFITNWLFLWPQQAVSRFIPKVGFDRTQ